MKTINQLLEELETIKNYVQNWTDIDNTSPIERDIVKHCLSDLYNSIHELNTAQHTVQTQLFDTPTPTIEPKSEPTPQPEPVTEQGLTPEPSHTPELDLESITFEKHDDAQRKNMINDLLIDSLYGDDEKADSFSLSIESIIDNAPELEPRISDVSFVEGEFKVEMQPPTAEEIIEVGTKRVWGEVAGSSTGVFNESFGAPRKDMATKIASTNGNDLHTVIGINDRYMLVRELFNGDIDAYDKTLDALNKFTDFDDCMIHIQENYRWKPNSEGVKLLINLISRKLN